MLYGVARVTKERETISGDNYACAATDEQFTMCLSDGMGSGMEASKESETVVELLEQFRNSFNNSFGSFTIYHMGYMYLPYVDIHHDQSINILFLHILFDVLYQLILQYLL